jgi:hypothetical protein
MSTESTNEHPKVFESTHLKGVRVVTASQVSPRPINFLWPGYLVRGLNNLVGDGGHGKGYIMADVAARVTRGDRFPDGSTNTLGPADVAIFEKEDHAGQLAWRLKKQRADLSRVHFVRGAFEITPEKLKALGSEMRAEYPDLTMLVFSPLNSYLPVKIDWSSDPALRRMFDPLAEFAEDYNFTVLTLTHPGKNTERRAQHKTLGGVAYVNAPRLTLASIATSGVVKPGEARPVTPGRFGVIKYNEGPYSPTLAFSIDDDGLRWDGPTDDDMRRLFEQADAKIDADPTAGLKKTAAEAFIRDRLYPDRRVRRKLLVDEAEKLKLCSPNTLDRAKDRMLAQGLIKTDGDDWVGRWPTGASAEAAHPELAGAVP